MPENKFQLHDATRKGMWGRDCGCVMCHVRDDEGSGSDFDSGDGNLVVEGE